MHWIHLHSYWRVIGTIFIGCTQAALFPEYIVNNTVVSVGLTEIVKALPANTLLVYDPSSGVRSSSDNFKPHYSHPAIDTFLRYAHNCALQTSVFTNVEEFFEHLLVSESRSEETTSLILDNPAEIVTEVQQHSEFIQMLYIQFRNLVFVFYYSISCKFGTLSIVHISSCSTGTQHEQHALPTHRRIAIATAPTIRDAVSSVRWKNFPKPFALC